jgi:hypothetical protein
MVEATEDWPSDYSQSSARPQCWLRKRCWPPLPDAALAKIGFSDALMKQLAE